MDFIKKHPLPWRLVEERYGEFLEHIGEEARSDREAILDANGGYVVTTADASGYQSWFEGDIDAFIKFINEKEGGT